MRVIRIFRGRHHATHAHAEVQRVEGSAQVDVERIINRSREYAHTFAQVINSLFKQLRILRHGEWADVGRHGVKRLSVGKVGGYTVLNHRHRIGLTETQPFRTGPG